MCASRRLAAALSVQQQRARGVGQHKRIGELVGVQAPGCVPVEIHDAETDAADV